MDKANAVTKEILGTLAIFFIIGCFAWLFAQLLTCWIFGGLVAAVASALTLLSSHASRSEKNRAAKQARVRARWTQEFPAVGDGDEY